MLFIYTAKRCLSFVSEDTSLMVTVLLVVKYLLTYRLDIFYFFL